MSGSKPIRLPSALSSLPTQLPTAKEQKEIPPPLSPIAEKDNDKQIVETSDKQAKTPVVKIRSRESSPRVEASSGNETKKKATSDPSRKRKTADMEGPLLLKDGSESGRKKKKDKDGAGVADAANPSDTIARQKSEQSKRVTPRKNASPDALATGQLPPPTDPKLKVWRESFPPPQPLIFADEHIRARSEVDRVLRKYDQEVWRLREIIAKMKPSEELANALKENKKHAEELGRSLAAAKKENEVLANQVSAVRKEKDDLRTKFERRLLA